MRRPTPSLRATATALAVVLAIAAVAVVVLSRPQFPPRLGGLAVVEGAMKERSTGLAGTTLRIQSARSERAIAAAGCAGFVGELRAGDPVTAWVDERGDAWRVLRAGTPVCTYVQAIEGRERSRHRRRLVAAGLAAAGVICAVVAIRSRHGRG